MVVDALNPKGPYILYLSQSSNYVCPTQSRFEKMTILSTVSGNSICAGYNKLEMGYDLTRPANNEGEVAGIFINIAGGERGRGAYIGGNPHVTIKSGIYNGVFGGDIGAGEQHSKHTGNSYIQINGGNFIGSNNEWRGISGTCRDQNTPMNGNVTIVITGGNFYGCVVKGGGLGGFSNNNAVVNMTISGGSFDASCRIEGYATSSSANASYNKPATAVISYEGAPAGIESVINASTFTAVCAAHRYSYDEAGEKTSTIHTVKCSNCGVTKPEEHGGGTATCTAKAKCSACRAEYGRLAPHNYVEDVCTACGFIHSNAVLFVSDNNSFGDGSGSDANNPFRPEAVSGGEPQAKTALYQAVLQLAKGKGGTIVFCGPYTLKNAESQNGDFRFNFPDYNPNVTIKYTSEYDGVDYRKTNNAKLIFSDSVHYICPTASVFEGMTILSKAKGNTICGGYNKIEMGEDLTRATGEEVAGVFISIAGGERSRGTRYYKKSDTHVIVRSGIYNGIYGGNVGAGAEHSTHEGNSYIEISGSTTLIGHGIDFYGVVGTNRDDNTPSKGNASVVIKGGTFYDTIIKGCGIGGFVNEDATVNITIIGGSFNGTTRLEGYAAPSNGASDTKNNKPLKSILDYGAISLDAKDGIAAIADEETFNKIVIWAQSPVTGDRGVMSWICVSVVAMLGMIATATAIVFKKKKRVNG